MTSNHGPAPERSDRPLHRAEIFSSELAGLLAAAHRLAETPRQAQLINALSWQLGEPLSLGGRVRFPAPEFALPAQTLMSLLIVEVAVYRARERAVMT